MGRFDGKVAVVTGASAGLGAALAKELARQGAKVALTARRKDRLESLAEELQKEDRQVLVQLCDVTRDGDLERVAEQVRTKFGRIDIVIANAGFGIVGKVESLSLDDFRRQFETNVFGVLRTVKVMLPDLKATRGYVGIVGSVMGYATLPGNSPYSMSKFSLRALAESLRYELLASGVSVTHIAPGFVATEIRQIDNSGKWHPQAKDAIPAWLQMAPETAARKIVRAMACRRREAVITGHGKALVWMSRHFPWLIDAVIRNVGVKARGEPKRLPKNPPELA